MDVIICDIDGTVLDVEPRIRATLDEIGALPPSGDLLRVSRDLPRRLRGPFYDIFLSPRYLRLDRPIQPVIAQVRELQQSTGLPLVYLSGRLSNMRAGTLQALQDIGLPWEEVLLRPFTQRMRNTSEWKIETIRANGYRPLHIFDDDQLILADLGAAFPEATLYDLSGAKRVPGGG